MSKPPYLTQVARVITPICMLCLGIDSQAGGSQYTDITAGSGIGLSSLLTESVAWGDYDNDGDEDLYLTNDGVNALFRNDGAGSFTDVTAETGSGNAAWGVGAAFGDLDNDGDLDLYVVNFSGGADVLYRNNGPLGAGGEYTFTDVSASAGTAADQSSSRGMALIDFDRDGLLDIYVNAIGPDLLYHNQGALTFTNVAATHSIDSNSGQGVGVVISDLNADGWIDLFTGNRSGEPNRLFLNQTGQFSDITAATGIDKTGLGMGVLAFDYDNDLDMDLYWTAWPGTGPTPNALYRNEGNLSFTDQALASGTEDINGWGISVNAGDFDNDGWQDFAVTNGFSDQSSANVLFHNNGDGSFSDQANILAGGADFDGRGVAFADFDNDGDLDLCITADLGADNRLWRNDSVNANHWLNLKLTGTSANRSAIGARVEVTTSAGTQVKEVSGGAGRGSFNSLNLEFGLGAATLINTLRIDWPDGASEIHNNLAVDQFMAITQGILFADGFE